MIVVTGTILARSDTVAELTALCVAHAQRSRAEPGCVSHNIHVDSEDPLRLFFYEQWADRDALAAHFRVPASLDFVRAARGLAAERTGARIFEATAIAL